MKKDLKNIFLIAAVSLFSTFLIWLPFFLKLTSFWKINLPPDGMATIMKNFDGLYYVVVAKSLYQPAIIDNLFSFPLSATYYTAHFPVYPLLIRLVSPLTGYLWGMLSITLISSVLAGIIFHLFIKEFKYSKQALWLSIIFLFFPARWLVVRSIGSPEPLFIASIIASFYFFKKKNYWLAGILGTLAQLLKPPGILLFAGFFIFLLFDNWNQIKTKTLATFGNLFKKAYPLLLIPLSLLGLFAVYRFTYGNFWAYFQGASIHPIIFPPFQVFSSNSLWVGSFWLEDIIYLFLLEAIGIVLLFKQKRIDLAIFTTIFFTATLFVAHRDLARYSLPLLPFMLIAFEPFLIKKEFKIAFWIIIIPIFLYAINFIAGNTSSIANWAPFL